MRKTTLAGFCLSTLVAPLAAGALVAAPSPVLAQQAEEPGDTCYVVIYTCTRSGECTVETYADADCDGQPG